MEMGSTAMNLSVSLQQDTSEIRWKPKEPATGCLGQFIPEVLHHSIGQWVWEILT